MESYRAEWIEEPEDVVQTRYFGARKVSGMAFARRKSGSATAPTVYIIRSVDYDDVGQWSYAWGETSGYET